MDSIELFPTNKMDGKQKIMVTIRLVFILSILGYMLTNNSVYLFMGMATAGGLWGVYTYKIQSDTNMQSTIEKFTNINDTSELKKIIDSSYYKGTKDNPLSNVMLTDYTDNPTRKSAPPTFNTEGINEVNTQVKKMVQGLNPTIDNTSKQLFGGLYNNFQLNNANRAFFATPNTKIPNDQNAFAQFLYGDMPSCKEDGIQCIKDNTRYNLY